MNKLKNVLGFGMLAAAFLMVGTIQGFAQSNCDDVDGYTALDAKIRENYAKLSTLPIAIQAGKEFLEKYGSCDATEGMATYLKANLENWEKKVKEEDDRKKMQALYERFDAGVEKSNFDDVYAAGKEIIAKKPSESLDQMIPMAAIGLYQTYNKNHKYNSDSLMYAKMVIDKIKAGETSQNKAWGVLNYAYGKKEDVLSEMTYVIGYITYYANDNKLAALPYFYEVAQMPGRNKTEPRVFVAVGAYYLTQAEKIGKEIEPLAAELKKLQEEKLNPERQLELDGLIKPKEAIYKAYVERALDSYGRAHKVAKNGTPAEKQYRDNLYKTIQSLYEDRFEKKDGLDSWLTTAVSKPMPNPLSEVTPVSDDAESATTSAAPAGGNGKTATVQKP